MDRLLNAVQKSVRFLGFSRWLVSLFESKKVMERETGLEPATSSLGSWHSTTELLPLNSHRLLASWPLFYAANGFAINRRLA